MSKRYESAFAWTSTNRNGDQTGESGLTKLEYFTAVALQGLLANSEGGQYSDCKNIHEIQARVAEIAIGYARETLEKLEKE